MTRGISVPPDRGQELAAVLLPAGNDALGIVHALKRQMGLNAFATFGDLRLDWTATHEGSAVTVSWRGTRRLTMNATRPGEVPFLIPHDSADRAPWIAALRAIRQLARGGPAFPP